MLANPGLEGPLMALSMESVFLGANAFIGNGPNFMVKAITDQLGCRTPSFPGYVVKFTLPILRPILAVVGWLFLR